MSTSSEIIDLYNNTSLSPTSDSNINNPSESLSSSAFASHSQSKSRELQPNFFKRFTKSLNLFQQPQQPKPQLEFATESIGQNNASNSPPTGIKRIFKGLFGKKDYYSGDITQNKMDSGDRDRGGDRAGGDRPAENREQPPNRGLNELSNPSGDDELDFESRMAEFFPDSLYRDSQHNRIQAEETTPSNAEASLEQTQSENQNVQSTTTPPGNQSTTTSAAENIDTSNNSNSNNVNNIENSETTTNTNNDTSESQPNGGDPLSGSNNSNNNRDTDSSSRNNNFPIPGPNDRAIVITVNYLFSDQNRPENPNRSGSLVLSLPNNSNNRDPGSIQEFIRIATQMAYTLVMNGLHNQPKGITLSKFELFEKVKARHFTEDDSKVCSICFEEFDDLIAEEDDIDDEEEGETGEEHASVVEEGADGKDAGNNEQDKEGYVVRKRRRLVDKTSRLLRRFSRSHTEAMEDGERRAPNLSESSSINDYVTPIASNSSSARNTVGTGASSNYTPLGTNGIQSSSQASTRTRAQSQPLPHTQPQPQTQPQTQSQSAQDSSQPVYLIDVKEPFDHSPIKMPCNHIFGQDCLSEWLKQHSTCPLCRHSVGEPMAAGGEGNGGSSPQAGIRAGAGAGAGVGAGAGASPFPGLFRGARLPQPQHQQINGQNYTFYTIPHESVPDLGNHMNTTGDDAESVTQTNFTNRLALLLGPALMRETTDVGRGRRGVGLGRGRNDGANDAATDDLSNSSIDVIPEMIDSLERDFMRRNEATDEPHEYFARSRLTSQPQPASYIQTLRRTVGEQPFSRLRDTSPGLDGTMTPIRRSGSQGDVSTTRSRSNFGASLRERMRRRSSHNDADADGDSDGDGDGNGDEVGNGNGNDNHEQQRSSSRSLLPGYTEIMNYIRNGFSGLRNVPNRFNGDDQTREGSNNDDTRQMNFNELRRREMTLHPNGLFSMRTANGEVETYTGEEVYRLVDRLDSRIDGDPALMRSRDGNNANRGGRGAVAAAGTATSAATSAGNDNRTADDELSLGIDGDDDHEDENENELEERRRNSLDSLSYHRRNYR